MPSFKLRVDGLSTGAVANTFLTALAVKFANTTGHRARLRSLAIGGTGGAPQDIQVSARLRRTGNTSDGTSTAVATTYVTKADPNSIASNVTAIGKNYTVEPTTYEPGSLGLGSFNARNTIIKEWALDQAPVWGPNQTLGLEVAPGSATATTLEVTLEWEEF